MSDQTNLVFFHQPFTRSRSPFPRPIPAHLIPGVQRVVVIIKMKARLREEKHQKEEKRRKEAKKMQDEERIAIYVLYLLQINKKKIQKRK